MPWRAKEYSKEKKTKQTNKQTAGNAGKLKRRTEARFVDQSQNKVKQKQGNSVLLLTTK